MQLWGESLGKIDQNGKKTGLTPISLVGAIDQHSFLQLIMQGQEDKFVSFLKIKDFKHTLKVPNIKLPHIDMCDFVNDISFNKLINSQCDATIQSLKEHDIPSELITIKNLNEKSLGTLIMYFELLTAFVGAMLEVNTYDQPAVEIGKKILIHKLKR